MPYKPGYALFFREACPINPGVYPYFRKRNIKGIDERNNKLFLKNYLFRKLRKFFFDGLSIRKIVGFWAELFLKSMNLSAKIEISK